MTARTPLYQTWGTQKQVTAGPQVPGRHLACYLSSRTEKEAELPLQDHGHLKRDPLRALSQADPDSLRSPKKTYLFFLRSFNTLFAIEYCPGFLFLFYFPCLKIEAKGRKEKLPAAVLPFTQDTCSSCPDLFLSIFILQLCPQDTLFLKKFFSCVNDYINFWL